MWVIFYYLLYRLALRPLAWPSAWPGSPNSIKRHQTMDTGGGSLRSRGRVSRRANWTYNTVIYNTSCFLGSYRLLFVYIDL